MDTAKFSKTYFGHLHFGFDYGLWVIPFCIDIDRVGISFHCLCFTVMWDWKKFENDE